MRQAVWSIDRGLPVALLRPMQEIVDESIVEFTFTMLTLTIAAGVSLLLGAIGLYGVLSYAVTLRTREIGVRLALGASPSRLMRSVVSNGVVLAGIGLVLGLAGAAGLTRFLGTLLFETEPLDLPTFAATTVALFVIAVLASYLPARRARRSAAGVDEGGLREGQRAKGRGQRKCNNHPASAAGEVSMKACIVSRSWSCAAWASRSRQRPRRILRSRFSLPFRIRSARSSVRVLTLCASMSIPAVAIASSLASRPATFS
jgi:hypothetical protein